MDFRVTEQDIAVSSMIYDETAEQAIDTDFTLPDYCPDISRVLKCRVTPRINSRSVNGGTLTVEGTACICLIYADEENGTVNSFEHPFSFTKVIEVDADQNSIVKVTPKVEFVNCRAVTQRRVDIHGAMSLGIKVQKKRTCSIVCDIDAEGIELLKEDVPATSSIGEAEKFLVVNDDLTLPEDDPPIRTIVRSDAHAAAVECRIISNKAVIKGELCVNILYASDTDRSLHVFENTLPLSQIVDIDGISEGCYCVTDMDVVSLELKPRTGMSGEIHAVSVSAKIMIQVSAYCNADVPLIYDVYCTKCGITDSREEISLERVISEIRESFDCKKTLELSSGTLASVTDMWCDSAVDAVKADGKKLIISGNVLICVLGEDSDGSPAYFERPVDFEYTHELDSELEDYRCEMSVTSMASSCTMPSLSSLDVKVELNISAQVFEIFRKTVITAASADETDESNVAERSALTIYYAEEGERIWDIAKFYNTSIEEIMSVNEINDEVLTNNAMLLIPSV